MSSDPPEIAHEKFRMWLRPDGVVQVVWAPGIETGLDDARAVIDGVTKLTGGRPSPLLVDVGRGGPPDRPARTEFARRDDVVPAVAVIARTPLGRMLGNFYLNVNKPKSPTRLFDDEASALAWLEEYV